MWRGTRQVLSQRTFHKKKKSNDYKEIFSLVLLKDSFKNIMALVVYFNLELHQMNIKIIFLNGDINETIYMVQ